MDQLESNRIYTNHTYISTVEPFIGMLQIWDHTIQMYKCECTMFMCFNSEIISSRCRCTLCYVLHNNHEYAPTELIGTTHTHNLPPSKTSTFGGGRLGVVQNLDAPDANFGSNLSMVSLGRLYGTSNENMYVVVTGEEGKDKYLTWTSLALPDKFPRFGPCSVTVRFGGVGGWGFLVMSM